MARSPYVEELHADRRLHYDDDANPTNPHRLRLLANRPLVAARFQAVLDLRASGCSTTELAWTFNVTEQGMGQLLERARAWHDWRLGKGDTHATRSAVVPKYQRGQSGRGIPSEATREPRERLVS